MNVLQLNIHEVIKERLPQEEVYGINVTGMKGKVGVLKGKLTTHFGSSTGVIVVPDDSVDTMPVTHYISVAYMERELCKILQDCEV